jgi:hypothetical protein
MRFLLTVMVLPAVAHAVEAGRCPSSKAFVPGRGDWNGWGVDLSNSRFQPQPGLAAADVAKLG